jgi:hypothetical protein
MFHLIFLPSAMIMPTSARCKGLVMLILLLLLSWRMRMNRWAFCKFFILSHFSLFVFSCFDSYFVLVIFRSTRGEALDIFLRKKKQESNHAYTSTTHTDQPPVNGAAQTASHHRACRSHQRRNRGRQRGTLPLRRRRSHAAP